jgi:hypothetical protein
MERRAVEGFLARCAHAGCVYNYALFRLGRSRYGLYINQRGHDPTLNVLACVRATVQQRRDDTCITQY